MYMYGCINKFVFVSINKFKLCISYVYLGDGIYVNSIPLKICRGKLHLSENEFICNCCFFLETEL